MKLSAPWAIGAILFACLPPALSVEGIIHFGNGDFIPGSWLSLHQGNESDASGIDIQSALLRQNTRVAPAALQSIQWEREPQVSQGNALLVMRNGDKILGNLTRFNDDTLSVDALFGEGLSLSRHALASLSYSHEGKSIYTGMHSLKGWTLSADNAWEVRENAFFTREGNATISRDVKLPAKFHLALEIVGKRPPQVGIRLWTTQAEESSHYSNIDLTPYGISIENRQGDVMKTIANTNRKRISLPVRFDLFVDRDAGTYLVYFNSERFDYETPQDEDDAAAPLDGQQTGGYGSSIVFFLPESNMGLKDLSISEWDGVFPGDRLGDASADAQKKDTDGKQDAEQLFLVNGDRLDGRITREEDGFTVQSDLYSVKVPLNVVSSISLPAAQDAALESPRGMAARLHLTDGSILTVGVVGKEENSLRLSSPYCSDFTLDLGLVRKVEFVHDERRGGKDSP